MQGQLASAFVFGQTGSGKTYTMSSLLEQARHALFSRLKGQGQQQGVSVRLAIFELYGTKCRDLLSSDAALGGMEAEPPFLLEDSGTGGGGAGASPPPPPPPSVATAPLKAAAASACRQRQGLLVGDTVEDDVASRGSSGSQRGGKRRACGGVSSSSSGGSGNSRAAAQQRPPRDSLGSNSSSSSAGSAASTSASAPEGQASSRCFRMLEDSDGSLKLDGLEENEVTSEHAFAKYIEQGMRARATSGTGVHEQSSRSHAFYRISVRLADGAAGELLLVDLAGSERNKDSAAHDGRLRREGAEINKSLMALKNCFRAQALGHGVVPFRASLLTRILKQALVDPHARTSIIATVSPSSGDTEHTLSTLHNVSLMLSDGPAGGAEDEEEQPPVTQQKPQQQQQQLATAFDMNATLTSLNLYKIEIGAEA